MTADIMEPTDNTPPAAPRRSQKGKLVLLAALMLTCLIALSLSLGGHHVYIDFGDGSIDGAAGVAIGTLVILIMVCVAIAVTASLAVVGILFAALLAVIILAAVLAAIAPLLLPFALCIVLITWLARRK